MGRERIVHQLKSAEETEQFGQTFASRLHANEILALRGDLGAGKTTFMQGLLKGFRIADTAQSPTFTYLQIYNGDFPIYHFDLYRIKSERAFILHGFDEFLQSGGLAAIEWPERIASLIPSEATCITFTHTPFGREAHITTWGDR
jgi:tRNA threonylcarbamoyladenosine biosynthesis protein TsaE